MHHSRLSGFVIDCSGGDLEVSGRFWSDALGMKVRGRDEPGYLQLDSSAHGLNVLVQAVQHESRVHLDIETDDLDAEVSRLESLGAARVAKVQNWWVMRAPTGQRFCVVERSALGELPGLNEWR